MCVLIPKKKKKKYVCEASIYRLESQFLLHILQEFVFVE